MYIQWRRSPASDTVSSDTVSCSSQPSCTRPRPFTITRPQRTSLHPTPHLTHTARGSRTQNQTRTIFPGQSHVCFVSACTPASCGVHRWLTLRLSASSLSIQWCATVPLYHWGVACLGPGLMQLACVCNALTSPKSGPPHQIRPRGQRAFFIYIFLVSATQRRNAMCAHAEDFPIPHRFSSI